MEQDDPLSLVAIGASLPIAAMASPDAYAAGYEAGRKAGALPGHLRHLAVPIAGICAAALLLARRRQSRAAARRGQR
jgi:hypothetical protein